MNKRVLLFLSQGFEEYEASVFTDVIGWSRAYGTIPVDLITTGLRPRINCTWNMIVIPELEFERINVEDFDALAIPGGFERAGFYEDAYDEKFLNLIREFDRQIEAIILLCLSNSLIKFKNFSSYASA